MDYANIQTAIQRGTAADSVPQWTLRLLRDIANGQALGDTTTLADATVVDTIRTASAAGKEE